jgi:putative membrane protein
MRARWLALLPLLMATPAAAHLPGAGASGRSPLAWTAEPPVLVPLLLLALGYACGILRLWRRAGVGHGVPRWRVAACALGAAALVAALLSPLDGAAERSFAAHMGQHMLLVVVAAPLLAQGQVGVVLLTALPGGLRRPAAELRHLRRYVATVPAATAVHGATIWLWHAPRFYEAALGNATVHYLEHLTMLGTGVLFWWSVVTARRPTPLGRGTGIAALFLTMLHTGLLGILITLAPLPLYASYAMEAPVGVLGPLEDQQVAGIVMLAGGFVYLVAALLLLASWLARPASAARRSLSPAGVAGTGPSRGPTG